MSTALTSIDISSIKLGDLADDLATGLRPADDVWNAYGLTAKADREAVAGLAVFKDMFSDAHSRWHSRASARDRIKAKSLVAIEEGIGDLFKDAVDANKPLNHRTLAFRQLSSWAGLEADAMVAGGGGGGVNITIDLSGGIPAEGSIQVIRGGEADDAEEVEELEEIEEVLDSDVEFVVDVEGFGEMPEDE